MRTTSAPCRSPPAGVHPDAGQPNPATSLHLPGRLRKAVHAFVVPPPAGSAQAGGRPVLAAGSGAVAARAALQAGADAGERQAAQAEDGGAEQVALACQAKPGLVAQGQIDDAQ